MAIVLLTEEQMAENGLFWHDITRSLRKYENTAKFSYGSSNGPATATGQKLSGMILDDPHADKGPYIGFDVLEIGKNGKKIKPPKKDYNTVGVRFLHGGSLHKVYTYRIRKGAKVHLGQELVAPTPTGDSVVVVVEIHKTPQDHLMGLNYKFVANKVAPL